MFYFDVDSGTITMSNLLMTLIVATVSIITVELVLKFNKP
jgi:hypothetical protein